MPRCIETERLRLVAWSEHDASELRRVLDDNDLHLRPWIPFMHAEPLTLEATRLRLCGVEQDFDAGEHFRYAIRERAVAGIGSIVGEVMLLARGGPGVRELGYWLAADECGKGYATEAAAPLVALAFAVLGAQRLVVCCDERNLASLRVAQRLGAVPVGVEDLEENGANVRLVVCERRRDAGVGSD